MALGAPATGEEVDRCVEDAVAACQIPAPTGHERRRAEWMSERLREAGLHAALDPAGSVIAHAPGAAGGRPVVVAAHLDTVFAGIDDIRVRREGDVLHAPGIGDNSLGLAGLLFLARRLAREPRPLVLAATVGEEGLGNLRGARAVVQVLDPAEFIALEGGGIDRLVTQGVGSARVAVDVTAAGGHSWHDRGQPSAVHVLVGLLQPLIADPGTDSVNVGEIEGGAGINVLAPSARATVELRDLDTARLDAALERLAEAARAAAAEGVGVSLDELGRRPGGAVAHDHPLVRDAVAALEAAGAGRPRLVASSTDANAALGVGIPAVTVGLAESASVHAPDERVDVSSLSAGLTALAGLAARRTS